jgi:hypothetical protein
MNGPGAAMGFPGRNGGRLIDGHSASMLSIAAAIALHELDETLKR